MYSQPQGAVTMKNNNIEKYGLTKRDLEVVFLRYRNHISGREIARKLGLTYCQVQYCFRKPQVKRYIEDVVMPEVEREVEQMKDDLHLKMAERIRQIRADVESDDPKKQKEAEKELARLDRIVSRPSKPMSDEELMRGIDEAVKRLDNNGENRTRPGNGEKCGSSANTLPYVGR